MLRRLLLVTCLGVLVLSCSSGETGPDSEEISVQELVTAGWSLFELGEYSQAKGKFREALEIETGYTEARVGLGWSLIRTDSLQSAKINFEDALSSQPESPESAQCGLAIVALADSEFELAMTSSNDVLESEPAYEFSHDSSIDYIDMHAIRAESGFHLEQFILAQQSLDMLYPENGLDPQDPSTWVIAGESYSSYSHAFLVALEFALANGLDSGIAIVRVSAVAEGSGSPIKGARILLNGELQWETTP
ncbi:MAG: hypothetical protein GY835_08725 [bacterium]|nr:hypothetical protein [bacterium]